MLIANATMKKMGLQGLFIEDFEDKPMGFRQRRCVLSREGKSMGPKISSVYILILNQGCPLNNIIPLTESPLGGHGDPLGQWPNRFLFFFFF